MGDDLKRSLQSILDPVDGMTVVSMSQNSPPPPMPFAAPPSPKVRTSLIANMTRALIIVLLFFLALGTIRPLFASVPPADQQMLAEEEYEQVVEEKDPLFQPFL